MRRSFGRPRSTGENKARWPYDGAGSQLRPGVEMAGAAEELELGGEGKHPWAQAELLRRCRCLWTDGSKAGAG